MKNLIIATGLVLLTTQAAQAGGVSPFYMGGSYGQTNNNTEVSNMLEDCNDPFFKGDYCEAEDSDKAWEVHAGVNITNNISVEVGYADLGNTADMYYSDPIHLEQTTKAVTAAGIVRMPLGKGSPVSLYGKAGVARWKSEVDVRTEVDENGRDIGKYVKSGTYSKTGTSPVIGIGAEYDITHNLTLRAGIDRYYKVGEEDQALELQFEPNSKDPNQGDIVVGRNGEARTIKTDVDVLSVGVNYQFF